MAEWKIQLIGHPYDLSDLAERLTAPTLEIVAEGSDYYAMSSDFAAMSEEKDVRTRAANLINIINGLGRFLLGDGHAVSMGNVHQVRDDGGKTVYLHAADSAKVRLRATVTMTVIRANGEIEIPQEPPRDTFFERIASLAAKDEFVREVLAAYAVSPSTWHSLYKVYEAISKSVGGNKVLVNSGWVATAMEIDQFTYTANNSTPGGDTARHITLPAAKRAKIRNIPLSDGQNLIDQLYNRWLRSL